MAESEIVTTLPADTRFVALARVMAASLAAELEFTIDDIEELRIAVDEAVTAVVDATEPGAPIEIRFLVEGDELSINVASASDHDLDAEVDVLTKRILAAVCDRFELGPGSAELSRRRSVG